MGTLALAVALVAFVFAAAALLLLWRGGLLAGPIPTTQPLVELPVLLFSGSAHRRACTDPTFRGSLSVELLYLPAPGRPRAHVRVTLEVRRRDNVSVTLASTSLGVFSQDITRDVSFDGELTNPCADGEFTVFAIAVNQGPGSDTIVESERILIDAVDHQVSMPHQISTTDGRHFSFDMTVTCCGVLPRRRIRFSNEIGVRDLRAVPPWFACAAPAAQHAITITGTKEDENRVGSFTIYTGRGAARCVLGSVLVE